MKESTSMSPTIRRGEILSTVEYGIDDTPKAQERLSSTTYSRPLEAVIRELATNGADANGDAGRPHVPVEIDLPTAANPCLVVRDSGIGMSRRKLELVVPRYFLSDKADDDENTGSKGLGVKSPYAMTRHFVISSVHAGMRTTCVCGVGRNRKYDLSTVWHAETNDPPGTVITVPMHELPEELELRNAALAATRGFAHPLSRTSAPPIIRLDGQVLAETRRQDRLDALRPFVGEPFVATFGRGFYVHLPGRIVHIPGDPRRPEEQEHYGGNPEFWFVVVNVPGKYLCAVDPSRDPSVILLGDVAYPRTGSEIQRATLSSGWFCVAPKFARKTLRITPADSRESLQDRGSVEIDEIVRDEIKTRLTEAIRTLKTDETASEAVRTRARLAIVRLLWACPVVEPDDLPRLEMPSASIRKYASTGGSSKGTFAECYYSLGSEAAFLDLERKVSHQTFPRTLEKEQIGYAWLIQPTGSTPEDLANSVAKIRRALDHPLGPTGFREAYYVPPAPREPLPKQPLTVYRLLSGRMSRVAEHFDAEAVLPPRRFDGWGYVELTRFDLRTPDGTTHDVASAFAHDLRCFMRDCFSDVRCVRSADFAKVEKLGGRPLKELLEREAPTYAAIGEDLRNKVWAADVLGLLTTYGIDPTWAELKKLAPLAKWTDSGLVGRALRRVEAIAMAAFDRELPWGREFDPADDLQEQASELLSQRRAFYELAAHYGIVDPLKAQRDAAEDEDEMPPGLPLLGKYGRWGDLSTALMQYPEAHAWYRIWTYTHRSSGDIHNLPAARLLRALIPAGLSPDWAESIAKGLEEKVEQSRLETIAERQDQVDALLQDLGDPPAAS